MKKIVTIIGARPQFIKAAAVSRAIKAGGGLKEIIVHTGQHFDDNMSSVFFREMEIPEPDYNLHINSLSHGAMTGRMLEKIESVLIEKNPDCLMVYGDTNSTIAGALAARKLNIKVVHVEAGLRSFNLNMPEEINRILTDRISDLLFCPTDNAVQNLYNEGFGKFPCHILKVGDVMYDAALYYSQQSSSRSNILKRLNLIPEKFILCTVHRQENTDNVENLRTIIAALSEVNKQLKVVLPLHPRTRNIMLQNNIIADFEPINPVGYFDILELLKNSALVATDSGGMQKESYFFNKYCLTLREETEWIELVENGYNFLTPVSCSRIVEKVRELVTKSFIRTHDFYGEGNASEMIVSAVNKFLEA